MLQNLVIVHIYSKIVLLEKKKVLNTSYLYTQGVKENISLVSNHRKIYHILEIQNNSFLNIKCRNLDKEMSSMNGNILFQ